MSSGGGLWRPRSAKQKMISRSPVIPLVLYLAFSSVLLVEPLTAQERSEIRETTSLLPLQELTLGGRNGWDEITLFENARLVDGWQGGRDIALMERRAVADETSELLLPFDEGFTDVAGRYRIVPQGGTLTDTIRRYGTAAAAFPGSGGLRIEPGPDTFFAGNRIAERFSIEFWFYPNVASDGARLLHWRGVVPGTGSTVIQELSIEISDGRLQWTLADLVHVPGDGYETRTLGGRRALVPRRWQHHRLSYDPVTARIAYDIDGVPVDIQYLTDTGRQNGVPRSIYLGTATGGGFTIGEGVAGVIDEFRVHRGDVPGFEESTYSGEPGSVVTVPIDLGSVSTRLRAMDIRSITPGTTEVRGFYRLADRTASRDPRHALDASWSPIPADGVIAGAQYGRYLQLRFDLLADAPRQRSPRLQAIDIAYETSPPPPPPTVLTGEPVPNGVKLQWNAVRTGNIAGYRIFFGEEPGRYTGTTDVRSPIDVGNDIDAGNRVEYEISRLRPDVPYVFAVQTYDHQGQTGSISREIEVRGGRGE